MDDPIELLKKVRSKQPQKIAGYKPRTKSSGVPEYDNIYEEKGKQYDVDPDLLIAQGRQESSFKPNAVSKKGAQGLSQFMPNTAKEFGVNVNDPKSSVDGQARLMRQLLDRTNDLDLSLAGYNSGHNAGINRLKRNAAKIPETRNYISSVKKHYTVSDQPSGQVSPLDLLDQVRKTQITPQRPEVPYEPDKLWPVGGLKPGGPSVNVDQDPQSQPASSNGQLTPPRVSREYQLPSLTYQEPSPEQAKLRKSYNKYIQDLKLEDNDESVKQFNSHLQDLHKSNKLPGRSTTLYTPAQLQLQQQVAQQVAPQEDDGVKIVNDDIRLQGDYAGKPKDMSKEDFVIRQLIPHIASQTGLSAGDIEAELRDRGIEGLDPNSEYFNFQARPDLVDAISLRSVKKRETLKGLVASGMEFDPVAVAEKYKLDPRELENALTGQDPQYSEEYKQHIANKEKFENLKKTYQNSLKPNEPISIARIKAERDMGWPTGDIEKELQLAQRLIGNEPGAAKPSKVNTAEKVNAGWTSKDEDRVNWEAVNRIAEQYGSLAAYEKEQNELKEKYKYRPLSAPLEFAKRFGNAAPQAVASILKTMAVVQELYTTGPAQGIDGLFGTELSKTFSAPNNPIYKLGKEFGDYFNSLKNKDFDNIALISVVPDSLGQITVQMLAGLATGGATLPTAIGAAMGGSAQYEEAAKFTNNPNTRLFASAIGAAAAIPDAIAYNRWLKGLNGTEKIGFVDKLMNSIYARLGVRFGEDAAETLTKPIVKAWLENAIKGGLFEGVQEVSENKINDFVAWWTYDPSKDRLKKLWSISEEDKLSFLGGLVGGVGGGSVQTKLESKSLSELKAAYESLPDLLNTQKFQKRFNEAQANEIVAKFNEEFKRRKVDITPITLNKRQIKASVKDQLKLSPLYEAQLELNRKAEDKKASEPVVEEYQEGETPQFELVGDDPIQLLDSLRSQAESFNLSRQPKPKNVPPQNQERAPLEVEEPIQEEIKPKAPYKPSAPVEKNAPAAPIAKVQQTEQVTEPIKKTAPPVVPKIELKPENIHSQAKKLNIDVNSPLFHKISKELIGVDKLDEMTPKQLEKVSKAITNGRFEKATISEKKTTELQKQQEVLTAQNTTAYVMGIDPRNTKYVFLEDEDGKPSRHLISTVKTKSDPTFFKSAIDNFLTTHRKNKNFSEFIKDTKVVDHRGLPQIMFHGAVDFKGNIFDPKESVDFGHHFGDVEQANARVSHPQRGLVDGVQTHLPMSELIPVVLNIKNPIRMRDEGMWTPRSVLEQLKEQNILTKEEIDEINPRVETPKGAFPNGMRYSTKQLEDRIKSALEAKGYDGMVYTNEYEGEVHKDSWIAFRPEQIKSIWNNGEFKMHRDSTILKAAADKAKALGATGTAEQWINRNEKEIKDWNKYLKGTDYDKLPGHSADYVHSGLEKLKANVEEIFKKKSSPEALKPIVEVDLKEYLKEDARRAAVAQNPQAEAAVWRYNSDPEGATKEIEKFIQENRKLTLSEWHQYITKENPIYAKDPFFKDWVWTDLIKLRDTRPDLPLGLDKAALAAVYADVKDKPNSSSFQKLYEKKVTELMLADAETNEILKVPDGQWIKIPQTDRDHPDFKANVSKVQAISDKAWCTSQGMAEAYLPMGDFWVLIKNNKSELAVRFNGNAVAEIQGKANNGQIPEEYLPDVKDLVRAKNPDGSSKVELTISSMDQILRAIRESKFKAKLTPFIEERTKLYEEYNHHEASAINPAPIPENDARARSIVEDAKSSKKGWLKEARENWDKEDKEFWQKGTDLFLKHFDPEYREPKKEKKKDEFSIFKKYEKEGYTRDEIDTVWEYLEDASYDSDSNLENHWNQIVKTISPKDNAQRLKSLFLNMGRDLSKEKKEELDTELGQEAPSSGIGKDLEGESKELFDLYKDPIDFLLENWGEAEDLLKHNSWEDIAKGQWDLLSFPELLRENAAREVLYKMDSLQISLPKDKTEWKKIHDEAWKYFKAQAKELRDSKTEELNKELGPDPTNNEIDGVNKDFREAIDKYLEMLDIGDYGLQELEDKEELAEEIAHQFREESIDELGRDYIDFEPDQILDNPNFDKAWNYYQSEIAKLRETKKKELDAELEEGETLSVEQYLDKRDELLKGLSQAHKNELLESIDSFFDPYNLSAFEESISVADSFSKYRDALIASMLTPGQDIDNVSDPKLTPILVELIKLYSTTKKANSDIKARFDFYKPRFDELNKELDKELEDPDLELSKKLIPDSKLYEYLVYETDEANPDWDDAKSRMMSSATDYYLASLDWTQYLEDNKWDELEKALKTRIIEFSPETYKKDLKAELDKELGEDPSEKAKKYNDGTLTVDDLLTPSSKTLLNSTSNPKVKEYLEIFVNYLNSDPSEAISYLDMTEYEGNFNDPPSGVTPEWDEMYDEFNEQDAEIADKVWRDIWNEYGHIVKPYLEKELDEEIGEDSLPKGVIKTRNGYSLQEYENLTPEEKQASDHIQSLFDGEVIGFEPPDEMSLSQIKDEIENLPDKYEEYFEKYIDLDYIQNDTNVQKFNRKRQIELGIIGTKQYLVTYGLSWAISSKNELDSEIQKSVDFERKLREYEKAKFNREFIATDFTAKVDKDGNIEISPKVAVLISRAEGKDKKLAPVLFTGGMLRLPQVNFYTAQLGNLIATAPKEWSKKDLAPLVKVYQTLKAQIPNKSALLYVDKTKIPHEMQHKLRYEHSGHQERVRDYYEDFDALYKELESIQIEAFEEYFSRVYFNNKEYNKLRGSDKEILHEETFVHLVDNKYHDLGLTIDQAAKFIDTTIKAYVAKNGTAILREQGKWTNDAKNKEIIENNQGSKAPKSKSVGRGKGSQESPAGDGSRGEEAPPAETSTQLGPSLTERAYPNNIARHTQLNPEDLHFDSRYYDPQARSPVEREAYNWLQDRGISNAYFEAFNQPVNALGVAKRQAVMSYLDAQISEFTRQNNLPRAQAVYDQLVSLVNVISPEATDWGQAISQMAQWSYLNPDAVIYTLENQRERAGKKRGKLDLETQEKVRQDAKDLKALDKDILTIQDILRDSNSQATRKSLENVLKLKPNAIRTLRKYFGTSNPSQILKATPDGPQLNRGPDQSNHRSLDLLPDDFPMEALMNLGKIKYLEGKSTEGGMTLTDFKSSVINEMEENHIDPTGAEPYMNSLYLKVRDLVRSEQADVEIARAKKRYKTEDTVVAMEKLAQEKAIRAAKASLAAHNVRDAKKPKETRTALDIAIDNEFGELSDEALENAREDVHIIKDKAAYYKKYSKQGMKPNEITPQYLKMVERYLDIADSLKQARLTIKAQKDLAPPGGFRYLSPTEQKNYENQLFEKRREKGKKLADFNGTVRHLTERPEGAKGKIADWYLRMNRAGETGLTAALSTTSHNIIAQRGTKLLNAFEIAGEVAIGKFERAIGRDIFSKGTFDTNDATRLRDLIFEELKSSSFPQIRKAVMDQYRGDSNLLASLGTAFAHKDRVVQGILAHNPDLYERMIGKFSYGDEDLKRKPVDSSYNKVEKGVEYGVRAVEHWIHWVTTFNALQEKHFRFATFLGVLSADLKARGIDPEMVFNGNIDMLDRFQLERAVKRALEDTFGEDIPKDTDFGRFLSSTSNAAKWIPFPLNPVLFRRFLFNSSKFLYEHTPLALAKIATDKGMNKRDFMKVVSGMGLFTIALQLLSQFGSDDDDPLTLTFPGWMVPDFVDSGNKVTLKMAAYNPLSSFLILANVVNRARKGKKPLKNLNEIWKLFGVDTRYPNLAMEWYKSLISVVGSEEQAKYTKFSDMSKTVAGRGLSAYLKAFNTLKDIQSTFDTEEATIRDYYDEPFVGELKKVMPMSEKMTKFLTGENSLKKEVATTGDIDTKEHPALNQLGFTLVPERQVGAKFTPAEDYLDNELRISREKNTKFYKSPEDRRRSAVTAQLYNALDKGISLEKFNERVDYYANSGVISRETALKLIDASKYSSPIARQASQATIPMLVESLAYAFPGEEEIIKEFLIKKARSQYKNKSLSTEEINALIRVFPELSGEVH